MTRGKTLSASVSTHDWRRCCPVPGPGRRPTRMEQEATQCAGAGRGHHHSHCRPLLLSVWCTCPGGCQHASSRLLQESKVEISMSHERPQRLIKNIFNDGCCDLPHPPLAGFHILWGAQAHASRQCERAECRVPLAIYSRPISLAWALATALPKSFGYLPESRKAFRTPVTFPEAPV